MAIFLNYARPAEVGLDSVKVMAIFLNYARSAEVGLDSVKVMAIFLNYARSAEVGLEDETRNFDRTSDNLQEIYYTLGCCYYYWASSALRNKKCTYRAFSFGTTSAK